MNAENVGALQAGALLALVESFGDYSAKEGNLPGTIVGYNALALTLASVLKTNPLGLTNLYWNAITNWTNIVIGYMKGERFDNYQYTAALLITSGLILLGMSGKAKK